MSASTVPMTEPQFDLPPPWGVSRVLPEDRRWALSMLLTGSPRAGLSSVDHFLDFLDSRSMTLDRFWLAHHEREPAHVALVVEAPGKAGMLFTSPVRHEKAIHAMGALIRFSTDAGNTQGLSLVQMLLDTHQYHQQTAAHAGGMTHLAHLQYMRMRINKAASTGRSDPPLPAALHARYDVHAWSEPMRHAFGKAILASYQDTLDCPGLLGLRHIDDIIQGHMGGGQFDPSLWHVLIENDQPAAVMLLNPVGDDEALEVAYLGLAPSQRGKGLAKQLMHHAIALAQARRVRELLLAVDENNTPAMHLYRKLGFTPTARKTAMIRAMRK